MDKNAIKKYAVWAREELIEKVTAKAIENGIVDGQEMDEKLDSINGKVLSDTRKKQRSALIKKIKEDGYAQVMEEVAYTWFNRFIAIRFMEVNGYLPSHVRVFSDENGNFKPQIMTEAIHLDIDGLDMEYVLELKTASKDDELFKYLLKVQCNALYDILPKMFSKLEDYTELLLPDYLLREGSVIEKLVNEIPEDNFDVNTENGQIEIIGWMYQYYISSKHDEVVDPLHGKVVKKEEVPAATQLFTTDWVVKYLIDNSVGRYWIERNPESKLADELTYFVKPKDGVIKAVDEKITPQDVTVFDPCVGSGHFLVYAFDVLMKIYVEYGFSERDAASEIVKNNLYGLDIDGRAVQLAYFAVMMKARQYDRRFLTRGIQPNVYEITESNGADKASIEYFYENDINLKKDVDVILDTFKDAKEYGAILQMPTVDFGKISERFAQIDSEISMYKTYLMGDFQTLIRHAEIMSRKYAVVATNPPYLNKYDAKLKKYINSRFKAYGGDLFSVFIYRNFFFCKENGYSGFMTPFVWMFIKTYEELRRYVIENKGIESLIQFEYSAYEEATVPICTFILKNGRKKEPGFYFDLSDFKGGMDVQNEKMLDALCNRDCGYYYETHSDAYLEIPGSTIAYFASEMVLKSFRESKLLGEIAVPKQGLATTDNNRFLRMWHEVDINNIGFGMSKTEAIDSGLKWFPLNKGGEYRKWYGNNTYVVNYYNDGEELIQTVRSKYERISDPEFVIKNRKYYFNENGTWSAITSGEMSVRYSPRGFIISNAGMAVYNEEHLKYIIAFLNSKCASKTLIKVINQSLNFNAGDLEQLPLIIDDRYYDDIVKLTDEAITISRADWDEKESSWDYQTSPLILYKDESGEIEKAYKAWEKKKAVDFSRIKEIEEQMNKMFNEIYGLHNEISPEISPESITIRIPTATMAVKELISYAVGCMFGRFSLEEDGLIYAGGKWSDVKYEKYVPDEDAIIPICDDEYFEDDIVGRFVEFIRAAFGENKLEENLRFIADALGGKGAARDVIRNYFINDFYADHLKVYQKRPIYWLFDSGRKNGFKCLVYMHRYQPDMIARIRTDYVHEQQARYRTAIEETANRIESASGSDKVKFTKRLNTLKAQNDEIHAYEEKIHHLADQMICIDIDDGVKKNYEIFKDVLAKIK